MSKKTDTDCFFTNWRSKVICDMAQTISKRNEEIAHLTAEVSRYREAGEVLEQAAKAMEAFAKLLNAAYANSDDFDPSGPGERAVTEDMINLARALRELAKPQE